MIGTGCSKELANRAPLRKRPAKAPKRARKADSKYVFPQVTNVKGVGLVDDYTKRQVEMSYAWDQAAAEVGCTLQDLRSTCATNLVAANIPIPAIAKFLGHSVKMLLEIYDKTHADTRKIFREVFHGRF